MTAAVVSGERGSAGPIAVAVLVTLVATALSYVLPDAHAATGVGLCFLGAVYVLVLRSGNTSDIRGQGLALGGLFEPEPLSPKRILRACGKACAWGFGCALLLFPPFWIGYVLWYEPRTGFAAAAPPSLDSDVFGQLLGIALPEEAFYRGYLQSALDRAWPPTRRVLGAPLGAGILVSSALFALGHFLTEPVLGRLAVFFPSLVFGYLRARTGGIGAPMLLHALCNLFATYLGRSYGLFS